jgi:molecular chaperone HscC
VCSTGAKAAMVIEKTPGRLSAEEIERARGEMARLKFHPRDALPNATLLARADALFVELQGDDRARLREVIVEFRTALETQDETRIGPRRELLAQLVSEFRR